MAADHWLRKIVAAPIAFGEPDASNIFDAKWQFISSRGPKIVEASIQETGKPIPSFRSSLGLPAFLDERVMDTLIIKTKNGSAIPGEDVSGRYQALPDCGQSKNSLYRRCGHPNDNGNGVLYFFLDSNRNASSSQDEFVFSRDLTRLRTDQSRIIVARLGCEWRLSHWSEGAPKPKDSLVDCRYTEMRFQAQLSLRIWQQDITVSKPVGILDARPSTLNSDSCRWNSTLVQLSSTNLPGMGRSWPKSSVIELDDKKFFADFAWILEFGRMTALIMEWTPIDLPLGTTNCETCSPMPTKMRWKTGKKDKLQPFEDPQDAALFERAVKNRPALVAVYFNQNRNTNWFTIEVGFNFLSLAHRAWSNLMQRLPPVGSEPATVIRLVTGWSRWKKLVLPEFRIPSNGEETSFPEDLGFNKDKKTGQPYELHEQQKKSLAWMIRRESDNAERFAVKEFEEAPLPEIGWVAEVCVQLDVRFRGGILADQVSYGKTVTSLALIHAEFEGQTDSSPMSEEVRISEEAELERIQATLIICPFSIVEQWRSEIKKFLPAHEYVLGRTLIVIKRLNDLAKYTLQNWMDAKVILFASSILSDSTTASTQTGSYSQLLADFAGVPGHDQKGLTLRSFSSWLHDACATVPGSLDRLRQNGQARFWEDNDDKKRKHMSDAEKETYQPSKRYRGAAQGKKKGGPTQLNDANAPQQHPLGKQPTLATQYASTAKDWASFKRAPLLHVFKFNRIIIDEFTYHSGIPELYLRSLQASKKWILSATPVLEDVLDVQEMAALIGVPLGVVRADAEALTPANMKKLTKELTDVEKFRSLAEKNTCHWHKHRHEQAQSFLDFFTRQNDAELVDDIECEEQLRTVSLDPHHMAVYAEVVQLRQLGFQHQSKEKFMGTFGSEERAVNAAVQAAKQHPLESYVSYVSCLPADLRECCLETLIEQRKERQDEVLESIKECLEEVNVLYQQLKTTNEKSTKTNKDLEKAEDALLRWAKQMINTHHPFIPERKAHRRIVATIEDTLTNMTSALEGAQEHDSHAAHYTEQESELLEPDDEATVDNALATKGRGKFGGATQSPGMAKAKAKTGRATSLILGYGRLEKVSQNLQSICAIFKAVETGDWPAHIPSGCSHTPSARNTGILSGCNHLVCVACIRLNRSPSAVCPVEGCESFLQEETVAPAYTLVEGSDHQMTNPEFGAKLNEVVAVLQRILEDEQAVLFVHTQRLVGTAMEALKASGIKSMTISTRGIQKKEIQTFTKDQHFKVLVLNVTSPAAAGLNITNANHILFLSPLQADKQRDYEATLTQAIGRVRRYGQQKKVTIWRFVALRTIDVDIIETRERRTTALSTSGPTTYVPVAQETDGGNELKGCCIVEEGDHDFAIKP